MKRNAKRAPTLLHRRMNPATYTFFKTEEETKSHDENNGGGFGHCVPVGTKRASVKMAWASVYKHGTWLAKTVTMILQQ